jgi:hypothetical protein
MPSIVSSHREPVLDPQQHLDYFLDHGLDHLVAYAEEL